MSILSINIYFQSVLLHLYSKLYVTCYRKKPSTHCLTRIRSHNLCSVAHITFVDKISAHQETDLNVE